METAWVLSETEKLVASQSVNEETETAGVSEQVGGVLGSSAGIGGGGNGAHSGLSRLVLPGTPDGHTHHRPAHPGTLWLEKRRLGWFSVTPSQGGCRVSTTPRPLPARIQ